jgi:hypothetical protein
MSEGRCKVCTHSQRGLIDQDIAGGMNNSQTAEKWQLSRDSVRRHRLAHLSPALKGVLTRRESAGAVRALDRLEDLHVKASAILDAAMADGKPSLSLAAIRELKGLTELLARITGELDERPQVQVLNVVADPAWVEARTRLLAALRPYPEAARAAALALGVGDE